MRGGKRGSHKGRERVLAENEDDIIARNMMVEEMSYNDCRKEKRRKSDKVMTKKKRHRKLTSRILNLKWMFLEDGYTTL